MGAAETIEALLQLGVSAKDAFTKAQSNKTATDWVTFLGSPEFAGIEDDVTGLVGKLTQGDLDAAAELMRKQGLAKADKKAARVAAEGVIVIERSADGHAAAMVRPLPKLRARNLRGGRVFHQIVDGHAPQSIEPGREIAQADVDVHLQALARDLALGHGQQV